MSKQVAELVEKQVAELVEKQVAELVEAPSKKPKSYPSTGSGYDTQPLTGSGHETMPSKGLGSYLIELVKKQFAELVERQFAELVEAPYTKSSTFYSTYFYNTVYQYLVTYYS